ncbi:hypothetical protein PV726_32440 [Streptomyces europaeiscabiei]|uniref:hypothetical protein n=1 Tax=Streptomyces europaeiscabiei TaxID=146819 RepID=UPI0029A90622|nr:hypothetical protein [Streptomyces europaeiscabiei]MDX3694967.1 hypothetical protein [Streptomyces europaeiscabiei]
MTVLYPRTPAAIATQSRMALGSFAAVPGVPECARALAGRLADMCTYAHAAINQDAGAQWQAVTADLHAAVRTLQPAAADRVHEHADLAAQAADAIARFERTAGVAAPDGAVPVHSFSVADLTRAAVRELGSGWHVASVSQWSTGGVLVSPDGRRYAVGVGTDDALYVREDVNGRAQSPVPLLTVSANDGLRRVARAVADTVRPPRHAAPTAAAVRSRP